MILANPISIQEETGDAFIFSFTKSRELLLQLPFITEAVYVFEGNL